MGESMKKIVALLIILTAAASFSQESLSVPMEKSVVCDTTRRVSTDSITLKTLKDVEMFYSNSFKDIQSSYNLFLIIVGAFIAIGCAVFGILGTWNWKKAIEYNRETKEGLEEVNKKLDNYKEMKNELEKIKSEVENERKLLEKNSNTLYGEVEYSYFSLAISTFKMRDYEEHFRRLSEHFFIFTTYKLKPEYIDLQRLTYFDYFIKKYDGNNIESAKIFLYELDRFIKYGETVYSKDTNNIESVYLGNIKEIWQKLCDKFGGQDKILEKIKNFNYHTYNFSISESEYSA
jgi:hypothetical protein